MSLRLRAVLIAGISLILLWALAAAWMMRGVQANLDRTLDERLAMSARMVSGLLDGAALSLHKPPANWADVIRVSSGQGIACEIRVLHGAVLAQTEGGPYSSLDTLPAGFSTREVDGKSWRIYILQDGAYQVTTADRIDKRRALSLDMLHAAGVPFLIAVFGGLLALWVGIGRGLAPLHALRQTLGDKKADDTEPIASNKAPPELLPVIAALNGLLGRLTQALAHQRAFTDAAAHELRSPLTVIDTHLQVAQLTEGTEAQASLSAAGEGVQRLRRILDQMMTLARTEAPAHAADQCVSVSAVLQELLSRMDAASVDRVILSIRGEDCGTTMPQSMLDTMVRNLLDNALRYSPAGSPVELEVVFDTAARQCRIEVADHGPGLSEQQIAEIGKRFWRGDQGRRNGDGAGLGISIVRAISVRFAAELDLKNRAGGGLVAQLLIPLS